MPSNFSRRSQHKKQTRLAFDPVEPSSSATMSPARLRYQMSSSPSKAFDLTSPGRTVNDTENDLFPSGKRYAVVIETPKKQKKDGRLPFKPLATPADSSQPQIRSVNTAGSSSGDHSDSDLDILPSFRRQQTHRLRGSSSPHDPLPLPTGHTSAGHPRGHRFMAGNKKRRPMAYDEAEDDSSAGSSPEEEEHITGDNARKATPKKKSVALRPIILSDDDSGVESPLESPTKVSVTRGRAVLPRNESPTNMDKPKNVDMRRLISGGAVNFSQKTKKTPQKLTVKHSGSSSKSSRKGTRSTETRSEDEDAIAVLPTPQPTGGYGTRKRQVIITDDSEDLEVEFQSSQRRSGRTLNLTDEGASEDELPSLSQIKPSSGRNGMGTHNLEDDGEEDDDVVVRSSARRLRKRAEKDNEEHDTDEDDEDPISSPLKRRRTRVDDDSESDPFTSPSKRFRPAPIEQKMENKTKGQTKRITRQQQPKKSHRTAREKKLELLKRQRAGEKIVELTSSESDAGEPQQGIYDSNSDLEVLSEFEDEEKDEDEVIEEVRRSLMPSNQNDNHDDFVVDDEDVPLGVPDRGLNDIPLEFTHHAHKPLKEHFKDVIEWMIQNKINPAFNRKDPIYVQAFRKLDMEVQGYATSIYSSAVWKEAFTRALWARPVFLESAIAPGDEHEGNKCDACGRTNHPATFEIQFGGKAYYKDTLDEVDNDHGEDEDEDEDSSSTVSVNSSGQPIPATDFSWFVGRFCRANAQTAHSLIHWKHALNDWVIDRLKTDGHLAAPKLAEREDWNMNKRSKYANRIVDEWEEEGEIKALYRDFKINLDVARQGKLTRWSK